ncbi:hypothetical protein J1N35_025569 [Gossypium stocksii]|uniref:Uncharacterized protein n=1 Tax=Gossypium stocksii TaxID=47602 RepID=A0A9D3V6U3_9ROSI|nr:hypothetical protein J1N35_025569 [Gossypium stocksii]
MRRTSVSLDKECINAQFGLTTVQDEHTLFIETITANSLSQVLKDLCIVYTRWTISSQECHTIERDSQKPIGKVWYHFLKSRLTSSTHNTIISNE